MFASTHSDLMANLSVNDYRLPTQEDFNGAMTAVMRLQDTYDLQPHELASGNLGKDKSLSMNGKIENNDVVGFVQIFPNLWRKFLPESGNVTFMNILAYSFLVKIL